MRVAQGLAVLVCGVSGLAAAQGADTGEIIGSVIAGGLAPLALAALFLVWSSRTRPYIPFLAVGIVILGAMGEAGAAREEMERERLAREEWAREASETKRLMNGLLDGSDAASPGSPAGGGAAPPRDDRAALKWAMNRVLTEIPAYRREVAARHGIDPDKPPPAWGTARYMANASAHPEVERFWEGYRAFLVDYRRGMPGWLRARATEHARGAGVDPAMLAGYAHGVENGAGRVLMGADEQADSVIVAALAFHRLLVSVDARVRYDGGRDAALFESDADLERVNRLQDRLEVVAAAAKRAKQERKERAREAVDSAEVYPQ